MQANEVHDNTQYRATRLRTYGTVHAIDGQVVSDEQQVYMVINDPNWNAGFEWVDVAELATMEEG